MTRLLNTLFIFASTLLLSIPLYAGLPADSLLDKYIKGLRTAIEQKVVANKTATQKDYLLVYDDPDPKFQTDFVNNGRDFWFASGLDEETALRNLINGLQDKTGGEPLYVVLGAVYNYADLDDVNRTITWSAKNKYKPAESDYYKDEDVRLRILPAIGHKKGTAGIPHSILYVISYFTVDGENYKVSHRCFYEGATSLKQLGFVVNATDRVEATNKTETNLQEMRLSYLKSTITAVAASMAQFSDEMKKINVLFANLPEDGLGKQFYNNYNGVCKDQLVLKKLALLINEIGLDTYKAYVGDKNTADGYDAVVFRAFYENLKKFYDTYKGISKQLTVVTSAAELAKALKVLSTSELGALNYPERIKAIRVLNQLSTLKDDTWWTALAKLGYTVVGAGSSLVMGSEQLMIKLIGRTPDSDVAKLKADLKENGYSLLLDIFKKTDDVGVGENNYTKLIKELAVMMVRNATAPELDDMYSKNRFYTWNNGALRTIIDDETTPPVPFMFGNLSLSAPTYLYFSYSPRFPERYKVTLQKYGAVEGGARGEYGQPVMRVCTTSCQVLIPMAEGNQQLDPFDFIAFIPEQDINFNTGFDIQAKQVVLVPAFFLQWYTDKKNNAAIKSDIKLGVNLTLAAVSIASGVGGLVTAATTGARILIAAQTFFAVTSLASAQYPEFNTFLEKNLGEGLYILFKSVEFGVNMYSALQGAAALGKGALNAAQRLSSSLLNVLKTRPDFLARLRQLYPEKFRQLVAWFKNFNGTNLDALAAGEGSYPGFLSKGEVPITYGAPSGGTRAGNFGQFSTDFVEPGASLLQTPGILGGGGSGVTALVMDAQKVSSAVKFSKGLTEQLKALYPTVDEGVAVLVQTTAAESNVMNLLSTAQTSNKVVNVLVLADAARTTKAVIAEGATATYVLYAQGAAKTEVDEYLRKLQECDLCENEPMICLLDKVADCKEKGDALAKLCGLPHSQRDPVCIKLLTYGKKLLNTFLTDLVVDKPSTQCREPYKFLAQNVRSLTPGIIAAWENYHDAYRTCLRVSLDHLRKMDNAWNNPRVRQAPFSFTFDDFRLIARAAGSAGQFATKIDNTIFDNIQSFCRLNATIVNMAKLKEKLEQENSGAALEGTNFILKYIGEHTSRFNGQVLEFEDGEVSNDRDVDLTVVSPSGEEIFYEFKSVENLEEGRDATADKPARKGFADQFTKDLRNAGSLDQIIWIFDKDKILTDSDLLTQILNRLKSDRSKRLLNSLDAAKKQTYFGWDPSKPDGLTDAQIQAFIRSNFTKLFKRD